MISEILLMRHGPVDLAAPRTSTDLGDWGAYYDSCGLHPSACPPRTVQEAVQGVDVVVSSELRRAMDSARMLGGAEVRTDRDLREVPLADVGRAAKLPLGVKRVAARLLWLMDAAHSHERIGAARRRARAVVARLEPLADTRGRVLVVGHGVFNVLIAAELRARGWRGPRIPPLHHWGLARYLRDRAGP